MTEATFAALPGIGEASRRRPISRVLFAPTNLAWRAVLIGVAVGFLSFLALPGDPPTVWLGLGFSAFAFAHTLIASREVPWIPGLMVCVGCLQWIVATVLEYHALGSDASGVLAVRPAEYFDFIVPATVALFIGVWWPLRRVAQQRVPREAPHLSAELRLVSEVMIWAGTPSRIVAVFMPPSIRFAVILASQLAFVGAFTFMLARERGWWIRLAAPMSVEAFVDFHDGMFLPIITWSMLAGVLITYRYRWSVRRMLGFAAAGMVVVMALNVYKHNFRNQVRQAFDLDPTQRAEVTGEHVADILSQPKALFTAPALLANFNRLNQGYLTSRVLLWVPNSEPFANGETVLTAVRASLLPRIVDENKYVAGGSETFTRFTGLELINNTSMNLSIPGEMYANFGRTGGIIGVLVYGLLIGLIFRWFARAARSSPLWWAWAPLILVVSVSGEDGLGETMNRLTKAALVVIVATLVLPGWRDLRRGMRRRRTARVRA